MHLIFDLNIIFGIQVQKFCFPLLHTIYLQRYMNMDEYENGTLLATSHCGNLLHTWLETCILDLCCKKLWDVTAPLVLHKSEKYSLCPIILSFEYFGDFRFKRRQYPKANVIYKPSVPWGLGLLYLVTVLSKWR